MAAAVILTFGLTIGLATTIYSVAASVLLRPFHVDKPEQLISIWKTAQGVDFLPLPTPEFIDLSQRAGTLEAVGGFDIEGYAIDTPRGPQWADALQVTPNWFNLLGVRPVLGRSFEPLDGQSRQVVILGEALWREAFAADPAIVGRFVRMGAERGGDSTYEVIGVVRSDLEWSYPVTIRPALYVPRPFTPGDRAEEARGAVAMITVARVRSGVPWTSAVSEIRTLFGEFAREHPKYALPAAGVRVALLHEELVGRTRPMFVLLAAGSLVLLLIGVVNIAMLLLAGGARRQQELWVKATLGASRPALLRGLLCEHAVLAASGCVAGMLLAMWLVPLLRSLSPEVLPRADQIRVDWHVLGFAALVSTISGLAFGLGPAWLLVTRVARPRAIGRSNSLIIAVEAALVVALLSAAAVIGTGVWRLHRLHLGFEPKGVLVAQLRTTSAASDDTAARTIESDLLDRIRRIPGVMSAAASSGAPFQGGVGYLGRIRSATGAETRAAVSSAGPDYFATLRIPVTEGRVFAVADESSDNVVVVNQTLARQLSVRGTGGQRIYFYDQWREVIGVVGDLTEVAHVGAGMMRQPGLERQTVPTAYLPRGVHQVSTRDFAILLVRAAVPLGPLEGAVRAAVTATGHGLVVRRVTTMQARVAAAGATATYSAAILISFASAALLLAIVGLHGLVSHGVVARTKEIGVRLALGASPGRVRRNFVRRTMWPLGLGLAMGSMVSYLGRGATRPFVFDVAPGQPLILIGVVLLLFSTGVIAAYLAARRVTSITPITALRSE